MAAAVRVDPEQRTFVLTGELDMSSCDELDAALAQADWLDEGIVRFDLSGLTFVDSSGLRSLMRAHTDGRKVVFDSARLPVQRILEITGLSAAPGIEMRNPDRTARREPPADMSGSAAE